jgi:hypothetical protein
VLGVVLHYLAPTLGAAGPGALSFDGSRAQVEVPDKASLRIPNNLTVEAWLKPEPVTGHRHAVAKDGYELSVEPQGSGVKLLFELELSGGWRSVSSEQLATGRWYHVAGTYDGATMALFVDGVRVATERVRGNIRDGGGPLRIGAGGDGSDFYPGAIDEVRVSAAARYIGDFPVPTSPLASDEPTRGLWHLDEGNGNRAADASPRGNHGTLKREPRWIGDSPFAGAAGPAPNTARLARVPDAPPAPDTAAPAVVPDAPPAPVSTVASIASPTPSRTPTPKLTPASTAVPAAAPAKAPAAAPAKAPPAAPAKAPAKAAADDAPQNTGGNGTAAGALKLAATYQSMSVYANFAGDADGDNRASFEYRKAGDAAWARGMDMTPDRRQSVFGANGTYPNPFRNQWRASLLMLQPNTEYEVRVTFEDPDGVTGTNPVVTTLKTRDENPPSTGKTYHVEATGADTNPGTEGAPFRTLQKAADTVAAGDTVVVGAGTYAPVSIARSGEAGNWIRFQSAPGARPLVSATGDALLVIKGSYVRFSGFELAGGKWGVLVGGGAHDVVLEKNIIRGQKAAKQEGVAVQIGDSFSEQNKVADVTVQDNDIRVDVLPEPESNVILTQAASGGHVIRRNKIVFYYPGGGVHGTDCVGGLPNFAPHGGFFQDTDVNDNYCEGATDEGIELDGGNANVRVWGNTIRKANIGFSVTPVYYGPVYVFRNVVYELQDHWIGSCVGVKDGESGTGAVFFYHNTFHAVAGSACKNSLKGFAKYGGDGAQANVTVKNNVLHFWGRLHETASKTFDYNLNFVEPKSGDKTSEWNGINQWGWDAFRKGTGQEPHGLYGQATFVDAAAGDYRLAAGSAGVDAGAVLPGFNDPGSNWPFTGAAPDIGAFER